MDISEISFCDEEDRLFLQDLVQEIDSTVWNGREITLSERTEIERKVEQNVIEIFASLDPYTDDYGEFEDKISEFALKIKKEGAFTHITCLDLEDESEGGYPLRDRAGLGKEVKKFWRKSKKTIIVVATVIIVIAGAAISGPSALAPGAAVVAKANESNSKKREVARASPNPREPFKSPIINAPLSSKPLGSRGVRNFTSKDVIEALPTFQYTAPPTPAVSETFNVYAIPTEAPSPAVQETFKLSLPPSSSPNYVDLKNLPPMQATLDTYQVLPKVFKETLPTVLTYEPNQVSLFGDAAKKSNPNFLSNEGEKILTGGSLNKLANDFGHPIDLYLLNPFKYHPEDSADFSRMNGDPLLGDPLSLIAKTGGISSLSLPDFTWGLISGLPKGIHASLPLKGLPDSGLEVAQIKQPGISRSAAQLGTGGTTGGAPLNYSAIESYQVASNSSRYRLAVLDGEVVGDASNRATFEIYKADLRAEMSKPHVNDPYLQHILDYTYRHDATVGSGSTSAAIRKELTTGVSTKGKFHSQKGRELIISYENWLKKNPSASPGDRAAAENVLKDLRNALGE